MMYPSAQSVTTVLVVVVVVVVALVEIAVAVIVADVVVAEAVVVVVAVVADAAAADRVDKAVVVSTEFVAETPVVVEVAVAHTVADVHTSVVATAVVGVVAMGCAAVVAVEWNCGYVVATVFVVALAETTAVVKEFAAVATDLAVAQTAVLVLATFAVTGIGLDWSNSAVADAVDMQVVDTSAVALAVAFAAGTVEIAFAAELETVNVEMIDIVYVVVVVVGYIVAMVNVAVVDDFECFFHCGSAVLPGYQDHRCCTSCQPTRQLRFP